MSILVEHIFREIITERQNQDEKWGIQEHNHLEWSAILGEEYGELCEALLIHHFGKSKSFYSGRMRDELIQLAAVAVAWIECIDRN